MIRLQRVYDEHGLDPRAGTRFLVDRLWPRGRKKVDLHLDGWPRDVGPSTELRRWFAHDVARWDEFRRRYTRELDAHHDAWEPLLEAARQGRVTLLYGARDTEHNNAVVLKDYLEARLKRSARTKPRRTVH
ncbi:DUF488 family protein [Corallococcus sp. AB045]|uniref:DUF488 domain-containing protein n=1 Tax=Corallococcus sp. AB045 TaxID=2316719 RepID=UPI000EC4DD61|nr:DUF488 family protein [Corallococcus sp. AB045]RKH91901.1 DUF488 family protein [Corallococcus sp. AB045]